MARYRLDLDHSLDVRAVNSLVLPGPLADDLRGRPRFERLLTRIGYRHPSR